ncbi:unnamed protein product [Somion occarium]|uniref:Uncharacterized protein n=1 Tax=Somion occarium TaxID=3059160 RepID=A0ABP1DUT6_9APHY
MYITLRYLAILSSVPPYTERSLNDTFEVSSAAFNMQLKLKHLYIILIPAVLGIGSLFAQATPLDEIERGPLGVAVSEACPACKDRNSTMEVSGVRSHSRNRRSKISQLH